jgi:DNA-binding FadR family transcriptional regulator
MATQGKRPGYTDSDGTRKAPYLYSEAHQQWIAAVRRGDKRAADIAARSHNSRFGLFSAPSY